MVLGVLRLPVATSRKADRAQGPPLGLRPLPAAGNPARPNRSFLPPQFTCGIREPSPLPLHGPGFLPRDGPFVGWRVARRIEGALLAVERPPTGLRELTLSRSILPVSGLCRMRLSEPIGKSAPPFPLLTDCPCPTALRPAPPDEHVRRHVALVVLLAIDQQVQATIDLARAAGAPQQGHPHAPSPASLCPPSVGRLDWNSRLRPAPAPECRGSWRLLPWRPWFGPAGIGNWQYAFLPGLRHAPERRLLPGAVCLARAERLLGRQRSGSAWPIRKLAAALRR